MFYSIVGFLALILNLILNWESLKKINGRSANRYRYFLIASNCYFIADIAWGILYANHHIKILHFIIYIDCVLYFFFMFLTMLTWIRYIVAFLDKRRRRSKALLYAVWSIFTLTLIYLIINYFHPFIFSINEKNEYITETGRNIAFILQIALYFITSTYMLFISHKSTSNEKVKYRAVGLTCLVMELFLILQILNPLYPSYAMGLLIGNCIVHAFINAVEMKEKEIYDQIATSMAEDYDALYYINLETGEYIEFSTSPEYVSMNVQFKGYDFFVENPGNIEKHVHPDDRDFALELHRKETIIKNLENRKSYSYKYRIIVNGNPRHFQFTMLRANDNKHIILYEKDIEDEFTAENMLRENQKKHVTFTQIAEILAVNYDVIYYVDAEDYSYISYECRNIYGEVEVQKSGYNFFEESKIDISNIVHKNDRDKVFEFIDRDHIVTTLINSKSCSMDYRIVASKQTHYVRMTVRKTTNGSHYIIGIENIDDEVKKERQHLKALNTEKELARRDELTGVKNKTAFNELEKSVQDNIDNGMDYLPFALVVCDGNNLKKINDTLGHTAGDEFIRKSANLLCNIFSHSPVFRIGGDEFVVFLAGNDFANRTNLMNSLLTQVMENLKTKKGPVVAAGIAEFNPEKDTLISEVFDRADKAMYKNKLKLKKEESQLG